jgi:hypothetical protein
MEDLKNKTFYANIVGSNGTHCVCEARVVSLISTFEGIHWMGATHVENYIGYVKPTYFKLILAGIGEFNKVRFAEMHGILYLTEEDACRQTGNYIYNSSYSDFKLSWMKITLKDLAINNNKFQIVEDKNRSYKSYYAKSWYWDGTMARGKYFEKRFQYDFANNTNVEYSDIESEFNKYKLYATKEMCEKDNTPTIMRFDSKPKQVEKIVTFEITTSVKVNVNDMPECEEEDAIMKAMAKVRTCADDVLYDSCKSCINYPIK